MTAAFGRAAEAVLVDRLRADGHVVLSLVAVDDYRIVGHVLFSRSTITAPGAVLGAIALAPLAVLPDKQGRGIGSALVEHGLAECRRASERAVIVLGDPAYYGRFGFSAELASVLRSPYSGEAFMALELQAGVLSGVAGDVQYPPAFDTVS